MIDLDGTINMIYDDSSRELMDNGKLSITRVSNVEPNEKGEWLATLSNGVILGPYRLRTDALDAEVKYIEENLL